MISLKSISRKKLYSILSLALLFVFLSAPAITIAQEAPAADGDASYKAAQEKRKEAEEKEIKQSEGFRKEGAAVKWVHEKYGVDPEVAARGFEFINFAIIVLAVGIPLFKVIPAVLRKRSAVLSADLEVAQAKTMDANERLSAVEAKLAGLDNEIAAIRKQVEEDMKSDEARAKTQIQEETARIVASAEQEIVTAGTLVQRGLKQFAADLAIDRAMSQLTLDAETDRALIAEFASDLTGKHSRKGGKA